MISSNKTCNLGLDEKGGASHVGVFFPKVFEMQKSWKRNKDENEVVVVWVLRFVCRSSWFPLLCLCTSYMAYMFVDVLNIKYSNRWRQGKRIISIFTVN